jgi:hypothetical protein
MLYEWIGRVRRVCAVLAVLSLIAALATGVEWLILKTCGPTLANTEIVLTSGIVMATFALTMTMVWLKLYVIGVTGPRLVDWVKKRLCARRISRYNRALCGVFAGPSKRGMRKWRKHYANK